MNSLMVFHDIELKRRTPPILSYPDCYGYW